MIRDDKGDEEEKRIRVDDVCFRQISASLSSQSGFNVPSLSFCFFGLFYFVHLFNFVRCFPCI